MKKQTISCPNLSNSHPNDNLLCECVKLLTTGTERKPVFLLLTPFFTALTFFFLKKLAGSLPILLYYPHEKSHAEKHFQYAASDEKHSLGEYSDKQREYWKTSKNIVVYESEDKLRNFIKLAKNNEIINSKMYFGKVNKELAERIKNVSYVSHTPHDLTVQTMYSRRKKADP